MSKHDVEIPDTERRARFTKALLGDLQALEHLIDAGKIETGVHRIGAEQEVFLVDAGMNPAPVASEILEALSDKRLTTEIARFNLEANLSPRQFGGSCLSHMETEIQEILDATRSAARERDAEILLVGILPTLRKSDLTAQNMAPVPRYAELDRAVQDGRGEDFRVRIKGLDEIDVVHDNVMLESCTTSFQLHFQVAPDEFARYYNAAQLVTAPVLACAVNSPVLLQRRLWSETRIALFPESVDDRATAQRARGEPPRVHFGNDWVRESVLEVLREDVAQCRILLASETTDDSMAHVQRGDIPELRTLRLFNGTVYRWNRPCFGVLNGVAHLRIENRALPAGPTIVDEIANAAFFYGLLSSVARRHPQLDAVLPFDKVKRNFFKAARHGFDTQIAWIDGSQWPIRELVTERLLPQARQGLLEAQIDVEDIDHYLGIMERRVSRNRNGSSWILDSLASITRRGNDDLRYRAVTASMLAEQLRCRPVHEWSLADLSDEQFSGKDSFTTVGQVMSTKPFTVRPGDVVDLATSFMEWERARYVVVEKDDGEVVGLISPWSLLRVLNADEESSGRPILVDSVMDDVRLTVTADTPLLKAITLMEDQHVGCLPVVDDCRLIGLLTHEEVLQVARELLSSLQT